MENKSEIRLINLSNYVRPSVIENKTKNWVLNGRNNSFYQYIIDRNSGSVTNSSINATYNDLIYGKGLGSRNQNTADWMTFKSILSDRDLRMIVSDFQLFGEASMQIIQTKGKKLSSIKHLPKNLVVPSIVNEDNEIASYWISQNWARTAQNEPQEFPAFEGKSNLEIYNIKPYKQGNIYFADPSYISCLPYAEAEEETSNLYLNSIKQGLSAGYIISVKGGYNYTSEEKDEFEKQVKKRLTGTTNASNFILSFDGEDVEVIVTPFPTNDNVHKQWSFLTEESKRQIMSAHRVISPSIIGLSTTSGFSSVADELDKAEEQLLKRVIAPKQRYITEAIEEVLVQYGINLNLYFKPLTEVAILPQEETKTALSEHTHNHNTDLESLISFGEDEDLDNYDIVDEIEVDYDEDIKLARVVSSNPNNKSEDDNKDVLIRYRYAGKTTGERDFCNRMINAKKVFRKEDIIAAENKAVNPGWGLNGADTYSIWLYKGGGNCHHKWNRVIYLRKGIKIDVNSPLAETISTSKARSKGYKVPTNENEVSIAPINMPKQGFVNR